MSTTTQSSKSVKGYITTYRASITHFEQRRRTSPTSAITEVYVICIAVLNAKIAELEKLDPEADGEPVCHKTDAQGCARMDEMQCMIEQISGAGAPMASYAIAMQFKGMSEIWR